MKRMVCLCLTLMLLLAGSALAAKDHLWEAPEGGEGSSGEQPSDLNPDLHDQTEDWLNEHDNDVVDGVDDSLDDVGPEAGDMLDQMIEAMDLIDATFDARGEVSQNVLDSWELLKEAIEDSFDMDPTEVGKAYGVVWTDLNAHRDSEGEEPIAALQFLATQMHWFGA